MNAMVLQLNKEAIVFKSVLTQMSHQFSDAKWLHESPLTLAQVMA